HFNIVFFGHLILWGITTNVLNRQDNAQVHQICKDFAVDKPAKLILRMTRWHGNNRNQNANVKGEKSLGCGS
ncbi:hypothetical protein, partial [Atlantibacter hermannii]|uniref:hypothetical protein n=1 Tax=Atlantibacter hermannii TaxID=565 RepID=UPI0028AC27AE